MPGSTICMASPVDIRGAQFAFAETHGLPDARYPRAGLKEALGLVDPDEQGLTARIAFQDRVRKRVILQILGITVHNVILRGQVRPSRRAQPIVSQRPAIEV